jgi:hypothetical protein
MHFNNIQDFFPEKKIFEKCILFEQYLIVKFYPYEVTIFVDSNQNSERNSSLSINERTKKNGELYQDIAVFQRNSYGGFKQIFFYTYSIK